MNPTCILAVVTARGGSKGIPGKNTVPLAGKPLIAWTIEAALQSRSAPRVIVSTDDEEIAQVAKDWGAEVPFMRPVELSGDNSPHIPVVLHAVQWVMQHFASAPDYILLLQPTSPLRTSGDIDASIQLALEKKADSVVGVAEARPHPYVTKRLLPDGRLEDFMTIPPGYLARQSLPPIYAINGAIYLVRRRVLLEKQSFFTDRTYAYVMPSERSLDIDTELDLIVAEALLRRKRP